MSKASCRNRKAPAAATAEAQASSQTTTKGDNMNSTTPAITVPFYNANLVLVEHNGQPYTPMKPIVEGMGLAWKPQFVKLQDSAERFGVTIMVIPVSGAVSKQEAICMPLRKLPGWLMTISPNKVKDPSVRERVIQYQNECDDALWDYWTKGQARNPRHSTSVMTALNEAVRLMKLDQESASICGKGLSQWKKTRKKHLKSVEKLRRDVQLLLFK